MCMIFVCESGVPTLNAMERAEKANDDGAGIAWRERESENGKFYIKWKKGLTAKEVQEVIKEKELEKYLPDSPFVIHFRACSSGENHPDLCQPFPITKEVSTAHEGTANAVLFHNGTYGMWESMMEKVCFSGGEEIPFGKWNDSRSLAWLAHRRGYGALFLTGYGGSSNWGGRLVVLDNKGHAFRMGNGWVEGEQKGVIQSGTLPKESTSCAVTNWNGASGGVGRYRYQHDDSPTVAGGGVKVIKPTFRPPPGFKSLLYEESPRVELFSTKELTKMLEEIKKDIDAYGDVEGNVMEGVPC